MNKVYPRKIRSFVRREGRMTSRQLRAVDASWPQFGLSIAQGLCDFDRIFARSADKIVEIGFGMGHSLIKMALENPDKDFIGIEVHLPGVGSLLSDLPEYQVTNVRIFNEDALDVFTQCIPDKSLCKVQLFFPDPWPKRRHHKRRLIQPDFVALLAQKLKPGGYLHLATDWQPYAQWMMEVLEMSPYTINAVSPGQYLKDQNLRPNTKFEARGMRLGHQVWDLLYKIV